MKPLYEPEFKLYSRKKKKKKHVKIHRSVIPEERGGESREPRKSSTAVLEIKKRASPPNISP